MVSNARCYFTHHHVLKGFKLHKILFELLRIITINNCSYFFGEAAPRGCICQSSTGNSAL